jgi:hypothetical protein
VENKPLRTILLSLLGNFFALFVPTLFNSGQIPGSTSDKCVTDWIATFLSIPVTGPSRPDFGMHMVRRSLNHRGKSVCLLLGAAI